MDAKKIIIFAVISCVLLSVCIDQTSAQGALRWGREYEALNKKQGPPEGWHEEKRTFQKKRGRE
jgi:hypothetical protein